MPKGSKNLVVLIGNLGNDPDIKHTQNDQKVANVSLATNEGYYNKDKEWKEATAWHRLVLWNNQAERASDWSKGDKVYVQGRIVYRKWEDKDGNEKYATEINVQEAWAFKSNGNGNTTTDDTQTTDTPQGDTVSDDKVPF